MDEILHQPSRPANDRAAQAEALRQKKEALLDRKELLHRKATEVLHQVDNFMASHRLRPGLFLLISLLLGGIFLFNTVYTPAYSVTVAGVELGTVNSPAVFDTIVSRVENRASTILGYDYTLEETIEYDLTLIHRGTLSPLSGFETFLFNQVGEVMKTYVLTVDGKVLGATAHESELTTLLEQVKAPYLNENTTWSEFAVPVSISHEYTASDAVRPVAELFDALTANINGETTYTVVSGDTYSGIAYRNDMSLESLMALNPQASTNRLMVGDVLTVKQVIPALSVRTGETVTYTQEIAAPVEYVDDASLYQGETAVREKGAAGLSQITANITYLNGTESDRVVTNTVVLSQPVVKVVAKGTKERPKTMAKGYFIWPVSGGRITSEFGYRSIFGTYSYHSGMDIAVPYGTKVAAGDGGTVTYSGYQGSYGNLVIINHGNGLQSYYAHNSSLLVSAGEKVYQGQVIARAGSTGRSTGSHCHFEVKLGGTSVNPRSYFK